MLYPSGAKSAKRNNRVTRERPLSSFEGFRRLAGRRGFDVREGSAAKVPAGDCDRRRDGRTKSQRRAEACLARQDHLRDAFWTPLLSTPPKPNPLVAERFALRATAAARACIQWSASRWGARAVPRSPRANSRAFAKRRRDLVDQHAGCRPRTAIGPVHHRARGRRQPHSCRGR